MDRRTVIQCLITMSIISSVTTTNAQNAVGGPEQAAHQVIRDAVLFRMIA